MSIIAIIVLAAVAAAAIWRVVTLTRRLDERSEATVSMRENVATLTATVTHLQQEIAIREQQFAAERTRLEDQFATERSRLEERYAEERRLREEQVKEEIARREEQVKEEIARREEQIAADREAHDRLIEARIRDLASTILRQNSSDLRASHEEKLREILDPLRENLDSFRKTVTDTYSTEARERFSLTEKIRELVNLNNTISRETRELTQALKCNNQVQGDWGEMILEGILERSGLREGEEYFLQVTDDGQGKSLTDENGTRLRPDVVVRYPDGRCVVIDSKVSLKAFIDWSSATDDRLAHEAAEAHVRSVRKHVDELARKKYQNYIGESRLDFVMMFIPNEPAYIAAMRHDPELWQDAYQRKVLIVSPTHLVAGLRLIEQLWSRDKVTKNAIKIAEDAGKMYDKFAEFTKDMERIASALASANKAHSDAMTKLSTGTGNLVKRAGDLRDLGIKATKQLAASLRSATSEE
ncbi:MAG: DNA recombination protein RmuC [Duncaniella sp.]|nr:DNA recombination protein RmuC [Duncaniella sp.]